MIDTCRVYAVEYSRRPGVRSEMTMGLADSSPIDIAYYFWVVAAGDEMIPVDLGFTAEMAARRGRPAPRDVGSRLREVRADPQRIRRAIVTHLHWDHAGCHALLPQARFVVQARELAVWTGRFAKYPVLSVDIEADDIAAFVRLNIEGRVEIVDGTVELRPGLRLHWVGGHSDGMQIVEVATGAGPVIIASDAVKMMANLTADLPDPRPHCTTDALGGYELIRRLAGASGTILAGHDADLGGVAERIGDGIYRIG